MIHYIFYHWKNARSDTIIEYDSDHDEHHLLKYTYQVLRQVYSEPKLVFCYALYNKNNNIISAYKRRWQKIDGYTNFYIPGPFHGEYKSYYKNGKIHKKFLFNNGDCDGDEIHYYKLGQIQYKAHWINNIKQSGEMYYKSGQIKGTEIYLNGLKNKTTLYYKNGQIKYTCYYINGTESGYGITYYKTGQIKYITTYIAKNKKCETYSYFSQGIDMMITYPDAYSDIIDKKKIL
jgi:antitoxin component YwqK of YwqJK toxin-antitoxin module